MAGPDGQDKGEKEVSRPTARTMRRGSSGPLGSTRWRFTLEISTIAMTTMSVKAMPNAIGKTGIRLLALSILMAFLFYLRSSILVIVMSCVTRSLGLTSMVISRGSVVTVGLRRPPSRFFQ